MTTRKIFGFGGRVLVLAFVSAIGFSQPASATPCSAEIEALKTALNDGFCRFSRKCHGLSHKLDKVHRRLEKGKFRHAARKLSDFGWIVEDMAMRRRPKISRADYEALMDPYYVAVANCIANGGVSAPPAEEDPGTGTGGGAEEPPPIVVPF